MITRERFIEMTEAILRGESLEPFKDMVEFIKEAMGKIVIK